MSCFAVKTSRIMLGTLRNKAAVLTLGGLFTALLVLTSLAQSGATPVTLTATATPSVAEPNVQLVRLQGSNFPTGTIVASSITVSLTPATPGTGPTGQTIATGFTRIAGTVATVTFLVPSSVAVATPTPYLVSISGTSQSGVIFGSTSSSKLTVDPPASVSASPNTGQQGQTLSVTLQGTYSNFSLGVTTANFGSGISVGGAGAGTAGPVAVSSATSATAHLVIAANASTTLNTVVVTTGSEQATTGFTVTAATTGPASVTATSGTPQSAIVSTAFANPLQAKVTDSGNNPLSGVNVTFSAPGSGASGLFANSTTTITVPTNASGFASSPFTANGTAGSYQVTGAVSGVATPATFLLTNTTPTIASLLPSSGALAQTLSVAVTGTSTHFVQGTTTASVGTGVTVTSLTVNSSTSATAAISISASAPIGNRIVTLTTGTEVANSASNAFSVTVDTTAPTVTSFTPTNGTTGVGDDPTIVLTFSKSMNISTLNSTNIVIFSGDSPLSIGVSSSGSRTAIISSANLAPNRTYTIAATAGVTDLSGNALVPLQSQFTTGPSIPPQSQGPRVVTQIPANGATDISQTTAITLYLSGSAIGASTLNSSSFQVSANGQLVNGTTSLVGSNAVQFTPSSPLPYGALIQVFLSTALTDVYSNPLQSAFEGQFTVQGNPTGTAPILLRVSPQGNSSTPVPLNVISQYQFDQPLLSSSINSGSARLVNACGQTVAGTVSLVNGNTVQFIPSAALPANCNSITTNNYYYFQLNCCGLTGSVTNVDGVAAPSEDYYFYVGTTTDSTTPTVVAVGPPNGTQNVGINASIYAKFSKVIDPISVNGSTISVTGASQTVVPYSISFDSTGTTAGIEPTSPLPPNTTITITIIGVTDYEGHAVTTQTSTFPTGSGPDLNSPTVVAISFTPNGTIPLNTTAFTVTFSEPMDPLSVTSGSLYLHDNTQNITLTPVSITSSSDMKTYILTIPASTLANGDQVYLYSTGATDVAGNPESAQYWYATVGATASSTPPSVTEVNPLVGLTNVPTNVQPSIEFNEEVSNASLAGIRLLQGSTPVPATVTLSNGDTVATITPNAPLVVGTGYTISASGVRDVQGTAMTNNYTSTFTTSANGINLVRPTVVSEIPANGAIGVAATVHPVVVFNEAMDPLTFDASLGYGVIKVQSNGTVVPATVSSSPDGKTVTFTPTSPLTSGTTYEFYLYYYITDVAGNTYSTASTSTFTIQ